MFGKIYTFDKVTRQAESIVKLLSRKFDVTAPRVLYDYELPKGVAAEYDREKSMILLSRDYKLDSDGIYSLLHEFAHHLDKRNVQNESEIHDIVYCKLLYTLVKTWKQRLVAYDYYDVIMTMVAMHKKHGGRCTVYYTDWV